jgi:hypothetical protein
MPHSVRRPPQLVNAETRLSQVIEGQHLSVEAAEVVAEEEDHPSHRNTKR